MIRKRLLFLAVAVLAVSLGMPLSAQDIRLDGVWQFMTDPGDVGEQQGWYKPGSRYDDTIMLPGSMPERLKGDKPSISTKWVGALYDSSYFFNPYMEKYRIEDNIKFPFFLTPVRHYVGKAWYRRTFTLDAPEHYELVLERPHIISKVWVNGQLAGSRNSLSIPHRFDVGSMLQSGENTIVICIDNDPDKVDVGRDSHSVTDQTQGCWNGIVGSIALHRSSRIRQMQVYPDVDNRKARVRLLLSSPLPEGEKATVTLTALSFNASVHHQASSAPVISDISGDGETALDIDLDMGEGMLLWDEFNPQLYHLTAEVRTESGTDRQETDFGMRKIEIRGKMFYVNGREIRLRGNVENCLFPNTGYPPTDLESWLQVFRRCKEFGLNHIRFHSYCPPESVFRAADIVGFYIQPEGPSWPNHGVSLGRGEYIDTYLYDEARRICDEYGNHPSFTFFAFGNEPAGNWVRWCSEHVPMIREYDPRHIYAGFSVGGGWAWQPKAEFAVKAGARGLDSWVKTAPESMADFSGKIATYMGKDMPNTPITVPFVTHEMGQWCAFPNFAETVKYTGVNRALNFEIFRDLLARGGMASRGEGFMMASGMLQTLCYKYEIERHLRTPDYAGFQLLSINDYSGQGSALVGVTDVFYGDKGYCTAEDFREFCSPVVPLARFPRFTYGSGDVFTADLLVSQYGGGTLQDARVHWTVNREGDAVPVSQGDFALESLPCGLQDVGHVSVTLPEASQAGRYTLTVTVDCDGGSEVVGTNHWNFWVYPQTLSHTTGDIYVTDSLDAKAQKILRKGGKVLICAAGKTTYGREVVQHFLPVFWNTSWFKMRPPHTTGLYIEKDHPVFDGFPTDYHSDLQWWELVNKARVMQFTDFPSDFQPIVQSIDTWFVSRKIGMLFEARVGKGRLMMTTMDISSDLDHRLAARCLRESIISYMLQDDRFQPHYTIDMARVSDLFTKVAGDVNMFTKDSPDELKPKLK